jgi:hypothetical protein
MLVPVPLHIDMADAFEMIGACDTVIVLVSVNGTHVPFPSGSLDFKVKVITPE